MEKLSWKKLKEDLKGWKEEGEEKNLPLPSLVKLAFSELTSFLQNLYTPFLLSAVDNEEQFIKLQESEKDELLDNYKDFKTSLENLLRLTPSFIRNILRTNSIFFRHWMVKKN
jgi:hypothetical protein